jgi:superfamily II RNA helicase
LRYKNYDLDPFQEEAIRSIEAVRTVIVAAPTGAGKTIIADYAVDKYLRLGKQIIYTAPIKALSNQKYRDFSHDYPGLVGIMTGDVVMNPNAPLLIMTTEIFRNIIFEEDARRLTNAEYVIFDEIHYINDIERGTVWEESIIFAPPHINFICLSATIPNLDEFASWVAEVRRRDVDSVNAEERPVPLEYKLCMNGYGLGSLIDFKAKIKELRKKGGSNHNGRRPSGEPSGPGGRAKDNGGFDLIRHIQEKKQLPCLFFSFSRRDCEEKAFFYRDRDFLKPREKEEILSTYDELCDRYGVLGSEGARRLRALVAHGVAYHHAGMMPMLKEVVERLFTSGLIKLLFTTETFAVGVNMPACSAVFGSLEKYDGVNFRYLKSREYQQMSGRAGRRGIDPKGYVYACVDVGYDDYDTVRRIVSEKPEKIESQFNLSYNSIINLYAKYGEGIYDVCDRSFSNFQNHEVVRELDSQLEASKDKLDRLSVPICIYNCQEEIIRYIDLSKKVRRERTRIRDVRRDIKRTSRGGDKLSELSVMLEESEGRLNALQTDLKGVICHRCKMQSKCISREAKLRKEGSKRERLLKRIEDVRNYQRNEIKKRLEVLRRLGYIEGLELLPRARLAAQISGYEVQTTELFFDGYFHDLDPDQINVLIMAIVFESRMADFYRKIEDKAVRAILQGADEKIQGVIAIEGSLGIQENVRPLDPKFSSATYAWSRGCNFIELAQHTDAADGDIVRSFRSAIDLLRQLKRAVAEDASLADKLSKCIARINRDVVDAERQLSV